MTESDAFSEILHQVETQIKEQINERPLASLLAVFATGMAVGVVQDQLRGLLRVTKFDQMIGGNLSSFLLKAGAIVISNHLASVHPEQEDLQRRRTSPQKNFN